MQEIHQMQSSSWLAQRLGLSITTIERLRAQGSQDLPPCHTIGKSKRYDMQVVEQWIRDKIQIRSTPQLPTKTTDSTSNLSTWESQDGEQNGND